MRTRGWVVVVVPIVVALAAGAPMTAQGLHSVVQRQAAYDAYGPRGREVPSTERIHVPRGRRLVVAVDTDPFAHADPDASALVLPESQVRVRVTGPDGERVDTSDPRALRDTFSTAGTLYAPVQVFEAADTGEHVVRVTLRDQDDAATLRSRLFRPLPIDTWATRLALAGDVAAVVLFALLWRGWRRTRHARQRSSNHW